MASLLPRLLLIVAGAVCAGTALAHDTWFEPLPAARPGEVSLRLGTGNRFPHHEFTVGEASLRHQGCRRAGAKAVPLQAAGETLQALTLKARPGGLGPVTCWAQQQPFDIEIAPATVEVYLKEVNASPAVRAAWAELQSRGLPWRERYVKHARIELPGRRANTAEGATPTGMAMDVLLESGLQPLKAGDTVRFQVLRDGQPLRDVAVELQNDVSPIGIWKKTDGEGRVSFTVPLAANWLLRGTDLRLSATAPDTWDSGFVTLAFRVGD
ncbi:DUF4198 domain-containing protein [Piscinibacter sp. HJYY11]|uniref:DUF4198 domain-containing protein n=1 Tax=Piscinibacter sp. HJYY11 TaxID=2801333 RepID=UPI00191CD1BC|nr:DUF4198 domain-containing protein [Piscinibacter sp. HJYY11]MBL0728226.1 DUF4198 domain-containing protein [Piscinibacter sp. HJYY11]